jgi:hypothetical protein
VQLGRIAGGDDPVEDRQLDHRAITVKELCTLYLADLQAGLILGKGGRPTKASTIVTNTGRIERHIIPLIGTRRVKDLTKTDINKVLKDIMAGKTRVSRPRSCAERPSSEAALERPRVPWVFSAASLPKPSKQGLSRATRPMVSASQRTTFEKRRLSEAEYRILGRMLRDAAKQEKYTTIVDIIRQIALIMAADTISGYIQGLLDGIEFRQTAYALDRDSRKAALARFLKRASGGDQEEAEGECRLAA